MPVRCSRRTLTGTAIWTLWLPRCTRLNEGSGRIDGKRGDVGAIAIPAPFPDVPVHVVESPGVRFPLADWVRFPTSILLEPGEVLEQPGQLLAVSIPFNRAWDISDQRHHLSGYFCFRPGIIQITIFSQGVHDMNHDGFGGSN